MVLRERAKGGRALRQEGGRKGGRRGGAFRVGEGRGAVVVVAAEALRAKVGGRWVTPVWCCLIRGYVSRTVRGRTKHTLFGKCVINQRTTN